MRALHVLLLLACGPRVIGTTDPDWVPVTVLDPGTACLEAGVDAPGTVHIDGEDCLSFSCARDPAASCTVAVDGDTITVAARFEWEEAVAPEGEGLFCTDDCAYPLVQTCEVAPLAAGTYTLVYGDTETSVTVPTDGSCAAQ